MRFEPDPAVDGQHDPAAPASIYLNPIAYLIGLEGVALMKAFAGEFDAGFTAARIAEVRALLDAAPGFGPGVDVPPMTSTDSYNGWARSYDEPGNGIFEIEEPFLYPLLDRLPAGVAVDAACGTGRLAAYLADRGHAVQGFDTSAEMLAVARTKLPDVAFAEADVRSLPLADSSVDLLTCALALTHIEHLAPVFEEAARVLRPGGHIVISDTRGHFVGSRLYPLVTGDSRDGTGYVPSWRHSTSEYLRAAVPHGFVVRSCDEPVRPGPIVEPGSEPDLAAGSIAPWDVWGLHGFAAEAANATYRDEPVLIIWDFELDGQRG